METTLADTVRTITVPDDHLTVLATAPPQDTPGWIKLSSVHSEPVANDLFAATLANVPNGARDVAGSYLASFAADTITVPVARALRTCRRGIVVDADTTWIRQHRDGWFDGVALEADVLVLADDPMVGRAGTIAVDDRAQLTHLTVERLAAVLGPLFASVRARAPYGVRGMWGAVADSIAADATWRAHVECADVAQAWNDAQPVIHALAAVVPVTRPTLARVDRAGHVAHLTIRGTCCLYYKSVDHPDGAPVEYCTSCPLGTDEERRRRQEEWLARDLAARG